MSTVFSKSTPGRAGALMPGNRACGRELVNFPEICDERELPEYC